jgi:methylglutamate dehydrogenase subunit D
MTLRESGCVADALFPSAPVSALDGIAAPGRHGNSNGAPGVIVNEIRGAGLATVMARRGRSAALAAAVRDAFGIDLPVTPRRAGNAEVAFVWSGPDQWLAHCVKVPPQGMEAFLAKPTGAFASIADQSHARTLLRISGPRVCDALAKGVAIDLHARVFKPGDAATTSLAQIGVQLWQIDDKPTYDVSVQRGWTESLWHWLSASSAEFGLQLLERCGERDDGPCS